MPDGNIIGEADLKKVRQKAVRITQVPGDVGPAVVTMLLARSIASAERLAGSRPSGIHSLRFGSGW